MPYPVLDIAKKIIASTNIELGDSITNLKLQKLLYYMQGYYLAVFAKPLFDEDIEAWMYGPVVPSVYDYYCKYERNAIPVDTSAKVITLPDNEEDLINEILDLYSRYSASALVDMTHKEMPWATSEDKGKGQVISKEKMEKFFRTKVTKPAHLPLYV